MGGGVSPPPGSVGCPVVEAVRASDRLVPTPTWFPFTTTTRLSSGIELSWFDRTYTGCTYRSESLIGITKKSPNTIVEPCCPSSVRYVENAGSWLICAKTCVGPSTLRPDGNVYAVSFPYDPGSESAAIHDTMFCRPSGVNGKISWKCSSAALGRRINE